MADVQDVVEIRDPEIDVQEVMERIQQRVRQRREDALSRNLVYDRLTDSDASHNTAERRLSSDFYYDLYQARQSADSIWVSLSVLGNERYPKALNSAITRVRHALHQVVIYYVNMLAGRQVVFNRTATDAMAELAAANEKLSERLEALEKEVATLRAQAAQRQSH